MTSSRTEQAVTGGALVITGASTGIGAACALRLDKLGFQVFAGVRKEADGEVLRRRASHRLTSVLLDVTDSQSIRSAVTKVGAECAGTLVGLVNNAGIAVAAPLEFLPIEELRRQFEVNVIGQIAVTQAFLPLLRRGRGRVVNIGSVSGKIALPLLGPYAASKFAMEALTDSLRCELSPWGLEVSIIEPSSISTPIWDKSLAAGDALVEGLPPEAHKFYGGAIKAMRRISKHNAKHGAPVELVVTAVEHALTATKPKTRYVMGRQARLQVALRFLPDRLRDRLVSHQLKRLG